MNKLEKFAYKNKFTYDRYISFVNYETNIIDLHSEIAGHNYSLYIDITGNFVTVRTPSMTKHYKLSEINKAFSFFKTIYENAKN